MAKKTIAFVVLLLFMFGGVALLLTATWTFASSRQAPSARPSNLIDTSVPSGQFEVWNTPAAPSSNSFSRSDTPTAQSKYPVQPIPHRNIPAGRNRFVQTMKPNSGVTLPLVETQHRLKQLVSAFRNQRKQDELRLGSQHPQVKVTAARLALIEDELEQIDMPLQPKQ